jgi:hypothetical protein
MVMLQIIPLEIARSSPLLIIETFQKSLLNPDNERASPCRWCEHDPLEIWMAVQECMVKAYQVGGS